MTSPKMLFDLKRLLDDLKKGPGGTSSQRKTHRLGGDLANARRALSSDPGPNRTLAPTFKNCILLESYFLPGDLETQITAFIGDYNHHRYHESINISPRRRLLLARLDHLGRTTKEQTTDHS